ncbi:restriction endonuclease [Chitinophaga sp. S165]|uniref:restriction endonuclease n=1 Tax=Chitinophaga sp. S165 TaxID=2135462 RepID=UPI000D70D6DD|nr:restriction endonuclease [Chitinophaga sp. S165]
MSRSDIHELLMLKLTGGLHTSQLMEVDHLISSNNEVSTCWKHIQDYYLVSERRRKDFDSISVDDIMSGLKNRMNSIHRMTFADIIADCRNKVLAFTRTLSFRPDLRPFLTLVNPHILHVPWIGNGHLSLEECRSLIIRIADNPLFMKTISPRAFEEIIGELYRHDGFHVSFTGKAADGGIDVILTKETTTGPQKHAIQCKRYRWRKVGIEAVRSLYGVKVHGSFTQAVMFTTSAFTMPATLFSNERKHELTLKNGGDVRSWCKAYRDRHLD